MQASKQASKHGVQLNSLQKVFRVEVRALCRATHVLTHWLLWSSLPAQGRCVGTDSGHLIPAKWNLNATANRQIYIMMVTYFWPHSVPTPDKQNQTSIIPSRWTRFPAYSMINRVSVHQTAPSTHRSLNNPSGMPRTQLLCFMASILSLFIKSMVRVSITQADIKLRRLRASGNIWWSAVIKQQEEWPEILTLTYKIHLLYVKHDKHTAMNSEVVLACPGNRDRALRHHIMTELFGSEFDQLFTLFIQSVTCI